jgi:RNA polymerase sigma factor (sigma-70 family)
LVSEDRNRAFSALVEQYGRTLYQLAFRLTGNEQDAKDVVQESFYRAFRSLDRFEGRADAGTWLYRIAANCAVDLLRRARSRPDRRQPVAVTGRSGQPSARHQHPNGSPSVKKPRATSPSPWSS